MTYVLGCVLSFYLLSYIILLWRDGVCGLRDAFGALCASLSVVMIGGLMWRGLLLP